MKRLIIYSLLLAALISACEEIYTPDIDDVENMIVADARLVKGKSDNYILLTETKGFNEASIAYPSVTGAKVTLLDDLGNEYDLPEADPGKFDVNVNLQQDRAYKISIKYQGNTFESDFEQVPAVPELDTVYGIPENKVIEIAGETDVDNFREVEGVQLYANMKATTEIPNYRFTSQNVMEYTWSEVNDFADIQHYFWQSYLPGGNFNIAAPPEYSGSKEIIKHPLYFFKRSVSFEEEDYYLKGWLMILRQYGISASSYNYYKDLNNQLDSEGRIFDPIYVQARGNLKCINNPDEIILGSFEISNVTEHRYFIRFISNEKGYEVRKVTNRSPVPWSGETIDTPPDFWVN